MLTVFISVVSYLLVSLLVLLGSAFFLKMLTPYNEFEEIKKGNIAVAIDFGGKILGVGNILHFAIITSKSLLVAALWGSIGIALLAITFVVFEHFMKDDKHEEIKNNNIARGIFSALLSITISLLVGVSIS